MTELEIFLMSALKQVVDLHSVDETQCKCNQCVVARQSLRVAQLRVQRTKCLCVDFINGNPDPVANPDCPIHGALCR